MTAEADLPSSSGVRAPAWAAGPAPEAASSDCGDGSVGTVNAICPGTAS